MQKTYRSAGLGLLWLVMSTVQIQAQPKELPLGSPMPMQGQSVQQVEGTATTYGALTGGKGTAFIFWSNQCPWIDKYEERVMALHAAYAGQGINLVLVNANDPGAFPQEAADAGQAKNYPLSYVMDTGSAFAVALGAFRTPHVFVFDGAKTLVYTGGIDDSPGDPTNVERSYLKEVLDALAQGSSIDPLATKAFGCRIKFQ